MRFALERCQPLIPVKAAVDGPKALPGVLRAGWGGMVSILARELGLELDEIGAVDAPGHAIEVTRAHEVPHPVPQPALAGRLRDEQPPPLQLTPP